MARKRSTRRRKEDPLSVGVKLLSAGVLFVATPFLLGGSAFSAGLRPMAPLGGLLLLVGGLMVLWALRRAPASSPEVTSRRERTVAQRRPIELTSPVSRLLETVAVPTAEAIPGRRPPAETWGPLVFEAIEWRRFEAVVELLFAQAGFETRSQSHGADGGVDIWLHSKSQGGAAVSIVQCKHWTGKPVGVDKVRELRGVMAAHQIARGQFATTSTFTVDARTFAKANGIHLLDIQGLLALIASRTAEQQQDLLAVAYEGEYWRPTCASCGIKLVNRSPRAGGLGFWGCQNYPRCKTRMQLRKDSSTPSYDL